MHAHRLDGITIRPLRHGDTETVAAVLERLGADSARRRFGAARPHLSPRELEGLARVDGDQHVLVAHVDGDPRPAAVAHLARDGDAAELAVAVADVHQGHGVGTALAAALAADARAAGFTHLHATVTGDNPRAVTLVRRVARSLSVRWTGGAREIVAEL